jgi:hypothetical protein
MSPVKVQLEILDIFLGELHIVYKDRQARFSLCGEWGVNLLGSIVSF